MNLRTDEELCALYQAGDRAAANAIVDRYWDLADLIALEYANVGQDADDRHMEAMQGLLKAAMGWRPGKGTKFKTFAKLAMRRTLIDRFRERHQKSQVPADKKMSLDAKVGSDVDAMELVETVADPLDVFDEVERRIYAEAATSHVLKAHKEVLFGVAQGYELGEIAAYLGIGTDHVAKVMAFGRAVGTAMAARCAA